MRGHLAMRNAIRDDFNGEAFRIADGVLARGSVTHHTRDFEGLSDPAAIVFALEFDGESHNPIIARGVSKAAGGCRQTLDSSPLKGATAEAL